MAAKTRQIVQFDEIETPPLDPEADRSYRQRRGFARSLGVAAFVAVPLLDSKNRCLGVVVADNRGTRLPISKEQVSLLAAFVNQAGIAVENARLYDTTQENLHNIHRLNSESESILPSIGACILSTDARGVVTRWNRATETTLALAPECCAAPCSRTSSSISACRPPSADALLDMVARVQETGLRQYRAKWTLHPSRRPPMTIDLHLARLLNYHQERAGVVLTFEDVTKEEQMEAEMDRMRRLADIGKLAAKMAHEVRNALSPIKGAAQIIRVDMQAQKRIDGVARASSSRRSTASAALPARCSTSPAPNRSTGARSTWRSFSLPPSCRSRSLCAKHRVAIHCQVDPDVPELNADPTQLGQVIRNIAMNAAQSMPDGGLLAHHGDVPSGRFGGFWRVPPAHGSDQHAGAAHAAAAETPADTRAAPTAVRLGAAAIPGLRHGYPRRGHRADFRPFVTTRPKGTGLGLPIVQKIVNQHGGRVKVESSLGQGTCFSVFLPVDAPESLSTREPTAPCRPNGRTPARP